MNRLKLLSSLLLLLFLPLVARAHITESTTELTTQLSNYISQLSTNSELISTRLKTSRIELDELSRVLTLSTTRIESLSNECRILSNSYNIIQTRLSDAQTALDSIETENAILNNKISGVRKREMLWIGLMLVALTPYFIKLARKIMTGGYL